MPVPENDFEFRLLLFFHHRIPVSLQSWSQAMIAELSAIEGFWNRLRWSVGGATTLLGAHLRLGILDLAIVGHRLDIKLVAAYQFLFSVALIAVMTWQLPRITESWKYAVPVLIMCYAIATLPAVLGFGLTLLDESARLGSARFCSPLFTHSLTGSTSTVASLPTRNLLFSASRSMC